jgi:hypothetical protein
MAKQEFEIVDRPSKTEYLRRSPAVQAILETKESNTAVRFKTETRAKTLRLTVAVVLRAEGNAYRARRVDTDVWIEPRRGAPAPA